MLSPRLVKGTFSAFFASAACAFLCAVPARAQVDVTVYDSYFDTGTDITMVGSVITSFQSPDINFGPSFFPGGQSAFGATLTGCITMPTTGTYTLFLTSDDGSYMFLDGAAAPFISNGGAHGPATVSNSTVFTAGVARDFRITFFEDFGPPSVLQLAYTGPGVTAPTIVPAAYYVCDAVPEPSATVVGFAFAGSLCGLITLRRRRK